jgi:hypothetical protein
MFYKNTTERMAKSQLQRLKEISWVTKIDSRIEIELLSMVVTWIELLGQVGNGRNQKCNDELTQFLATTVPAMYSHKNTTTAREQYLHNLNTMQYTQN